VLDPPLVDRVDTWVRERTTRIAGRNPWLLSVNVVRNCVEDRVGGLAAEMAFWALLSMLPLLVAIAALLGYAGRLLGDDRVRAGQDAIVNAGSVVFSNDLTTEVVRPFVGAMLQEGRGGVAVTGLAVALYLASRVFAATIRALDLAYRVEERRGLVTQRMISLLLALGFVLVIVAGLLLVVVGPLLGGGQSLADRLGFGPAFEFAWFVLRWPFLITLMTLFLAWVYLWGPNVDNRLRHCLPGALLGVVTWIIASVALRVYLAAGGGETVAVTSEDAAVALVARVIGTVVAALLWTFITGLAILLGGELNAELERTRV
jgi:membrane protein